jgi:hypothetical protein
MPLAGAARSASPVGLAGTCPALQVAEQAREHPVADLSQERIKRRPVLGGLVNEYQRAV